jgi:hypothetical protein
VAGCWWPGGWWPGAWCPGDWWLVAGGLVAWRLVAGAWWLVAGGLVAWWLVAWWLVAWWLVAAGADPPASLHTELSSHRQAAKAAPPQEVAGHGRLGEAALGDFGAEARQALDCVLGRRAESRQAAEVRPSCPALYILGLSQVAFLLDDLVEAAVQRTRLARLVV